VRTRESHQNITISYILVISFLYTLLIHLLTVRNPVLLCTLESLIKYCCIFCSFFPHCNHHSFHTATTMPSSALSSFMLSLPTNLTLASDNARSACQPAVPPVIKLVQVSSRWGDTNAYAKNLVKASARWGETEAYAKPVKASSRWSETESSVSPPKAPACLRSRNSVWNEPSVCSVPSKVPKIKSLESRKASACLRSRNSVWNEPSVCSVPSKVSSRKSLESRNQMQYTTPAC
jgi:hypothetical protein